MSGCIERYWRNATKVDAVADTPMLARFRDNGGNWISGELHGWRRDDGVYCWINNNGDGWMNCQVYGAIDPGEGWVLIDPDKDEPKCGDQYWDVEEGQWMARGDWTARFEVTCFYRRRVTPDLVPYTWEDRSVLYGRYVRRKDGPGAEFPVEWMKNVNGRAIVAIAAGQWTLQELLDQWEFTDGTAIGKPA